MDLQTAPPSLRTTVLGASAAALQRSSQELQSGAGDEFANAMQTALGSISAKLQEVKTALNAAPQAQQRPELAEAFKGFGVLMDQLAQAYGGAAGGGVSTAMAVQSTASMAGRSAMGTDAPTAAGAPAAWESYSNSAAYQEIGRASCRERV